MRFVLNVGFKDISPIYWRKIFSMLQPLRHDMDIALSGVELIARRNESIISHKTGSISHASMVALFGLGLCYRPQVIVEVGTYTGRSGLSLLLGARLGLADQSSIPKLYTCDLSASETGFGKFQDDVIFFAKRASTEMFSTLTQQGIKADLVFLDGRLNPEDLSSLGNLLKPETIFAFDDFEGNEKGVYNCGLISKFLGGVLYTIYPPSEIDLSAFQIIGQSVLGVGLHPASIQLTRQ